MIDTKFLKNIAQFVDIGTEIKKKSQNFVRFAVHEFFNHLHRLPEGDGSSVGFFYHELILLLLPFQIEPESTYVLIQQFLNSARFFEVGIDSREIRNYENCFIIKPSELSEGFMFIGEPHQNNSYLI